MTEQELNELASLIAEDDFAQWLALGVQPQEADALRRLQALEPFTAERYADSDVGNGYLYADYFRRTARYVSERKCWYIYDGAVWKADTGSLAAMEKCKELALLLLQIAAQVKDGALRDAAIRRAQGWHSRRRRETILKDAAGVHSLSMRMFDTDSYIFNCLNGTLDLRTMRFHDHRPEDMLTMISGVCYDPQARCPRWERFMQEIMLTPLPEPQQTALGEPPAPSAAMAKSRYLQKALGYALCGSTRYECLFILYGATTRNGKGTTMETMLRLMGDYGRTARPESIGARMQQSGSSPSEDIARLRGARLVNISEPDKKLTLSAALVKSMTGNDTLTARFLHENSFEYRPQFKMFINTNYLPQITDLTLFSSGRIKTIPFERHFEEEEQDRSLKETFSRPQNLSGILNWCIEGLRLLEEEGLAEPDAVREATAQYAHESDKLALFMEEFLEPAPAALERTARVYAAYQRWCQDNGFCAENVRNFRALLSGYARVERRRPSAMEDKTSVIVGLRLRSEYCIHGFGADVAAK
ncbi:MAG: DNA primase [Clostridia bacterium]|nr:DNA primase [Clostridia bacterium]